MQDTAMRAQEKWHDVGEAGDFPDEGCWPVEVEGRRVAVFRLGEELFALHDECTHGAARLSEGFVVDGCVECPLHQGLFDLRTGEPRSAPAEHPVQTYRVRTVAGRVEIRVARIPRS
jgi:nitrite reductase/ring-hydroxylating ferredoxin subunit